MLSEPSGSTLLLTNSSTLVSTSKPTSANVHKIPPPLSLKTDVLRGKNRDKNVCNHVQSEFRSKTLGALLVNCSLRPKWAHSTEDSGPLSSYSTNRHPFCCIMRISPIFAQIPFDNLQNVWDMVCWHVAEVLQFQGIVSQGLLFSLRMSSVHWIWQ